MAPLKAACSTAAMRAASSGATWAALVAGVVGSGGSTGRGWWMLRGLFGAMPCRLNSFR